MRPPQISERSASWRFRGVEVGMTRESIAVELHAAPDGPKRVHRCTYCGAHDHWKEGWLWYGDYLRAPIKVLCPECAEPYRGEVIP
jgi:hypothetical protein